MNEELIRYLMYLGATRQDAINTIQQIMDRVADGDTFLSVLEEMDLPSELIELF
jgi:endonuclease YncB( thermonuclease family)